MGSRGWSIVPLTLGLAWALAAGGCDDDVATNPVTPDAGPADAAPPPDAGFIDVNPPDAGGFPWTACKGQAGFDCGSLTVPMDYDDPSVGTFELALTRIPAQATNRIGVLLVNFGGPGAPTVDALQQVNAGVYPLLAGDNALLYQRFDIIGVDWRGVAKSKPSVSCFTPTFEQALLAAPLAPKNAGEWTTLFDTVAQFAPGCQAATDAKILARVDTANAARDMEAVRVALGEEKLNYLGYSYGTVLGAMYATLFPTRVRGFVLDSPFMFGADRRDRWRATGPGMDDSLSQFFAWCAGSTRCTFGPTTGRTPDAIAAAYDALVTQLDATPLATSTRPLDGAAINLAAGTLLYQPTMQWLQLAKGLQSAATGDGKALRTIADGAIAPSSASENLLSAGNVISMLDYPLPAGFTRTDLQTYLETEIKPIAPRAGYASAVEELPFFLGWPVAPAHPRPPISAPTAPPLLITATRHDPATTYSDGPKLQSALGNGSYLITYEGAGHAQAVTSPCLGVAATLFLLDPTKAPKTTSCPALVIP